MPSRKFAIEAGAPKRLEVSWKGMWKEMQVAFDDVVVGTFANKKELEQGREFTLSDGSLLAVTLKSNFGGPALELLRNGQPLPGSDTEPEQRVKGAATMLYVIAGLNIVLGAVAAALQVELLQNIGLGIGSIVVGAVYGGLGYVVRTRQSLIALIAAIALFWIDGLAGFVAIAGAGGNPPVGAIVGRIFFTLPMIQGIPALRELSRRKRA